MPGHEDAADFRREAHLRRLSAVPRRWAAARVDRRRALRDAVSQSDSPDPDLEVVRIYQLEGQGVGRPRELSREAGDVVTSPLFPQLELSLDAIVHVPA